MSVCQSVCLSVCLSVCVSLILWDSLETLKILHTFSLGEYLGGVFFSIFKYYDFWGLGKSFRQNEVKSLGQPESYKNGQIWLKFCSLGEYLGVLLTK